MENVTEVWCGIMRTQDKVPKQLGEQGMIREAFPVGNTWMSTCALGE